MTMGLLISLTGAVITLGGLCISFGVLKAKITENSKINAAQVSQLEQCVTRGELAEVIKRSDDKLAQAIKHSDDMLELMRARAEEDRAAGEGKYKELYGIINFHGERIAKLETSHAAVMKSLDELKTDLRIGLKEIRDDIKDLKRQE